jgi:reductive dehalogenase
MDGNPIEIGEKYAILIVVRKDSETTAASTGKDWICDSLSFSAYQRLALVSQTMATYIRKLGFRAEAQHFSLYPKIYKVLLPPLLLWAGLGEVGRSGIVINPFIGPSYKVAAVLTDLPLVPDKPIDFGLKDFCRRCQICAERCPSKAISAGEEVTYNGYELWKPDEERCARFFISNRRTGSACNMCVKVCPWTRPTSWNHNLVRWSVRRSGLARRVAVRADTIWKGHQNANGKDKWWFDLSPGEG